MSKKQAEQLWEEFLNSKDIDSQKNFFENGGDSLKAMQMLQKAESEYGVEIDMMSFFENSTIETMVEASANGR